MTKVKMTRETLFAIAGFTSLKANQLAAKHLLKTDLKIQADRLQFLASRFNEVLKNAGSNKFIMATKLRADGFKVSDCVVLMLKKGLDVDIKADEIKGLIDEARKEL